MNYLTTIDYWAFRVKIKPKDVKYLLARIFRLVSDLKIEIIRTNTGWQGYKTKCLIQLSGKNLGIIAYGGENQKEWVYVGLSGDGCSYLSDINKANEMVAVEPTYQLRRVDIALTVSDGSLNHEGVLKAYHSKGFQAGVAGRPPKLSQILPGQVYDGRTIYIGSRTGDKFLRCYEKGYEMIKGFSEFQRSSCTSITLESGESVPIGDLYRIELELKAKTGDLPLDIIPNRDNYFAGSYPYLGSLIASSPKTLLISRNKSAQMTLEALLDQINMQYGNSLFTALHAYDGDIGSLMSRIIGKKHNKALVEAGVLIE